MTLPSWFPARLATYALVGTVGTAAHYAVFLALLRLGTGVVAASTAGYVVGAVVNYGLNYKLTFRSVRRHREAAVRFFAVAGLGLILNVLIVALAARWFPPLAAQIAATATCLLATYAINSIWSFREVGIPAATTRKR